MTGATTLNGANVLAASGAQLSFPNVTTYTVPTGASVQWAAYNTGSVLSFPNLTTITGPSQPNSNLQIVAQYGGKVNLPALTTITKPDDGDPYPNSGVQLFAYDRSTISAPLLATFNDNDSHPNSSLEADGTGVLAIPKLLAPKGVNINLNAPSHPEQFTSLAGTRSFQINTGTVVMSNLASITGFGAIGVNNGAQLSFPNVTTYTVPTGASVQWAAYNTGSVLSFPNLTTITGPSQPNSNLQIVAQYGGKVNLPALTTITKPDDGDPYPNSGVQLFAYDGSTISAPLLATFNDNDSHPNSSLEADGTGVLRSRNCSRPRG